MIRDDRDRASFIGIEDFSRVKLVAFVFAGVFAGVGGVIMSLLVLGAYPELADWTISGGSPSCWRTLTAFLGPTIGTVILLLLNDFVTKTTEYYGLTVGIVILFFALGLRRGLLDFLIEWWRRRTVSMRSHGGAA